MGGWCWKCGLEGTGFCRLCGGVCERSYAAWFLGRHDPPPLTGDELLAALNSNQRNPRAK